MKKTLITWFILAAGMICSHSMDLQTESITPQQPDYTGTWIMVSGDARITLSLQQETGGTLKGFLRSSNGNSFPLEGMISEGIAAGVCRMEQGGVFFEAYVDGNDLTLSLIEPDEYNMPDYDRAQYLVLSRSEQQVTPGMDAPSAMEQLTGTSGNRTETSGQQQAAPDARYPETVGKQQAAPSPGRQAVPAEAPGGLSLARTGSETVKDEINGYSFRKPVGWNHQVSEGFILLGSNTIPGLILTFPHQSRDLPTMMQEMQTGIQEEGIYLTLSSQVNQKSASMANCYYEGIVQGEQAKAYGLGVLNPEGGGLFILAVSTPDKLGKEIEAAANTIGMNATFIRPKAGDQQLVKHFAGEWAWSNGYRSEWLMFYPDGSFSDQYEAAYSGNTTDGWGNQTGNWGATNQSSNRGRWNIQGTMDAGVITIVGADGSQTSYDYRVFVENGQKYYREYVLNGYHYRKNKDF